VCPICLPVFLSFQLLNEPGLGVGINPGMALTPLPSGIGWDLNPQPSNSESSLLTTRPDFCPGEKSLLVFYFEMKKNQTQSYFGWNNEVQDNNQLVCKKNKKNFFSL